MLKEGAAGPLASGRAASSPRAALLSLGSDLAGLGGKQGLDSLTSVTRTPAATNFLIPCKTLAMAHFFLGQGFPNRTTGNTGSLLLPGFPGPKLRVGHQAKREPEGLRALSLCSPRREPPASAAPSRKGRCGVRGRRPAAQARFLPSQLGSGA